MSPSVGQKPQRRNPRPQSVPSLAPTSRDKLAETHGLTSRQRLVCSCRQSARGPGLGRAGASWQNWTVIARTSIISAGVLLSLGCTQKNSGAMMQRDASACAASDCPASDCPAITDFLDAGADQLPFGRPRRKLDGGSVPLPIVDEPPDPPSPSIPEDAGGSDAGAAMPNVSWRTLGGELSRRSTYSISDAQHLVWREQGPSGFVFECRTLLPECGAPEGALCADDLGALLKDESLQQALRAAEPHTFGCDDREVGTPVLELTVAGVSAIVGHADECAGSQNAEIPAALQDLVSNLADLAAQQSTQCELELPQELSWRLDSDVTTTEDRSSLADSQFSWSRTYLIQGTTTGCMNELPECDVGYCTRDVAAAFGDLRLRSALMQGGLFGRDPRPDDAALVLEVEDETLGDHELVLGRPCDAAQPACEPLIEELEQLRLLLNALDEQQLLFVPCTPSP